MQSSDEKDLPTSTVLVTGFEPFGGEAINPSGEIARRLHGWQPQPGTQVKGIELPCVFGAAIDALRAAIDRHRPELVIALGQASSRSCLGVERIAINIDDARIPDNAGNQPIDEAVITGAPAAMFSGLPIKAIVEDLRRAGIPAEVSQSAGTFVCNHVFYGLQHMIATRHPKVRGGFIHVPCTPQQSAFRPDTPSMALETIEQGVRRAVLTSLRTTTDRKLAGGAID